MRNNHSRVPDFNSFKTHSGDKFHQLFDSHFREDGTIELVAGGRKDIQAEINSHLEETDMALIVHRLQYGDTSVLTSKKPMYGDFTQFPTTYAQAFDMVTRSEKAFESLSPEIKQQFDNNVAKWFSSIGSPEWLDIMGLTPAPVVPDISESEVTD